MERMRKNYSTDFDYHTQRNNVHVPFASCNRTSMVMAFKQARWPVPFDGRQEEDAVYEDIFNTEEAKNKQAELAPWSLGEYPPDQVHVVLEWGFNKWVGQDADTFSANARAADLLITLESGGGVVLSGRFPRPGATHDMGHIVSLAGYVMLDASSEIVRWIVDDPYGDWHSNYTDAKGNNIDFTLPEFERIFDRGDGKYYAHMIRRYSA